MLQAKLQDSESLKENYHNTPVAAETIWNNLIVALCKTLNHVKAKLPDFSEEKEEMEHKSFLESNLVNFNILFLSFYQECIQILQSELSCCKAKLAVNAGTEDLMLFFFKLEGNTESVCYIESLKEQKMSIFYLYLYIYSSCVIPSNRFLRVIIHFHFRCVSLGQCAGQLPCDDFETSHQVVLSAFTMTQLEIFATAASLK